MISNISLKTNIIFKKDIIINMELLCNLVYYLNNLYFFIHRNKKYVPKIKMFSVMLKLLVSKIVAMIPVPI